MPRLIPMPSPRGTNLANAWILPVKMSRRDAIALDQGGSPADPRSQSQRFSPDLTDPIKDAEKAPSHRHGCFELL
jgi:hypothetical protein